MISGQAPTIFGDGNQTRDYVFIDDTVHAFVQAMDAGSGKLVNVGTGLETSVNHLYCLLSEITGSQVSPSTVRSPAGSLADGAGHLCRALRDVGSSGPTSRTGWLGDGRLPQGTRPPDRSD